mmetsp:Transcript_44089/g.70825  ORF Transcript_44089/g.70825 Transcript_44089/m.70825 type:complete len:225 (+) Transcript_44089:1191-1865(+)
MRDSACVFRLSSAAVNCLSMISASFFGIPRPRLRDLAPEMRCNFFSRGWSIILARRPGVLSMLPRASSIPSRSLRISCGVPRYFAIVGEPRMRRSSDSWNSLAFFSSSRASVALPLSRSDHPRFTASSNFRTCECIKAPLSCLSEAFLSRRYFSSSPTSYLPMLLTGPSPPPPSTVLPGSLFASASMHAGPQSAAAACAPPKPKPAPASIALLTALVASALPPA